MSKENDEERRSSCSSTVTMSPSEPQEEELISNAVKAHSILGISQSDPYHLESKRIGLKEMASLKLQKNDKYKLL